MHKFITFLEDNKKDILPADRKKLKHHIKNVGLNLKDVDYMQEWFWNREKWRTPPVSIDTFIDHEDYLGIGKTVYPVVRMTCNDIINGKYLEGIIVAGIGTGKSYVSQILCAYMVHILLCMRDPFGYYYMDRDKNLAVLNMGVSATQAWDTVFSGITSFVERAKFFQQFQPKMMRDRIIFEKEKIMFISGNSTSKKALGYNIFAGVLDEASFYISNEDKDVAEEIYNGLQRRIVSRFGKEGLLLAISSPRFVEDFLMNKLEEAAQVDENGDKIYKDVYCYRAPSWKGRHKQKMDLENKFYFNCRKNTIIKDMTSEEIYSTYKVLPIEGTGFDETCDVWEIPGEYRTSFMQNPENAKRDFGAIPSEAISGFIPNPVIVDECYNTERTDPVVSPGKYEFTERPLRTNYYIHIDIGLNKGGKGDKAGLAMGHFVGWEEDEVTKEKSMKVCIDLMESIELDETLGEVDLAAIRRRVYDLKAMGYNIKRVSYDQYQSRESIQLLTKRGIKAELLSVDRTVEPYNLLKEAIYGKRLDIYYHPVFDKEIKRLEVTNGNKIDHIKGGSKDLTDGCAGVMALIHEYTPKSEGGILIAAEPISNNPSTPLQQHAQQKAKIQRYRDLQEQVNAENEENIRMYEEEKRRNKIKI